MAKFGIRGTVLVAATLTLGLAVGGTARAQSNECLLEFQDASTSAAITDDGQACAEATGKVCTFQLKLCVNQDGEGCSAGSFAGKKIRAKGHCGPVGQLRVSPSGDSATCGSPATIKVRTKKNGQREGRCVISATANAGGRKDIEKIVLVCKPTGTSCPNATTTTTSLATTTSTLATTTTTVASTTTTTVASTTTTIATTTTTVTVPTTTTTIGGTTTTSTTLASTTTTVIGPTTTTTTEPTTSTTLEATTTTTEPTTSTTLEATTTTTEPTTSTTLEVTTTTTEPTTSTTEATTTTTSTSTTSTTMQVCDCCSDLPSLLTFTTGAPSSTATGSVLPSRCAQGSTTVVCTTDADCSTGVCRGHLDAGGLYFGGGQNAGIGLPASIPNKAVSYTKVASCSGGDPVLTATVAGDIPAGGCSTPVGTPSQGTRHCTAAGCLFGPPLPIPNLSNPATSTCIINEVATSATGSAVCTTGATTLSLPLTSHVYLTGGVLGTQSCALCTGGTVGVCGSGTCTGGSRNGMACTPESDALVSHDCPPPAAPPTFIGDLPIPFNLSTGTQTKTSFAAGPQARVFCGFCADTSSGSIVFNNPAQACTSDTQCPGTHTDCNTLNGDTGCCAQQSNGAFRNAFATTITETGSDAGACISDGTPQASTLVSVFCIPPSYDPIVDPSGELPGPGAVSLPGTAQFLP